MVSADDFLGMFSGLPQNATPAQIAEARLYAETLGKPSAGGQSGPYQVYGKWNALADAMRGALGGYIAGRAGAAERASIARGAGAFPNLGNFGPAQPSLTSPSGIPPQVASDQPVQGLQASRARFTQELQDPKFREHFLATMAGEQNDPTGNLAVMESAMNRAAMMGTPLASEVRPASGGGYYAGYNESALKDPAMRAILEKNLEAALRGSNVSNYATDNASGDFGRNRIASGMFGQASTHNGEILAYPQGKDARGFDRYPQWRESVAGPAPQRTAENLSTPQTRVDGGPGLPAAPGTTSSAPSSMLPALPSDEQIHALMNNPNPEYHAIGRQLYEQKRQALQPQMLETPMGQRFLFNPYSGTRDVGIPGKPMVERFPYEIPGVYKAEKPAQYQMGPNGQMYLQTMPMMAPGETPPGSEPTNIGRVPPMQPSGPLAPQPGSAPQPGFGGQYQPLAAPGGPQGGFQPVQQPPIGGLNVGPAGAPVSNDQLYGEMAGPSAVGPFPIDKNGNVDPKEAVAWKMRKDAAEAGMKVASEKVWGARGEQHAAAITAGMAAPKELQQLAILQDAYNQPHTPGGPLAEHLTTMRSVIAQVFGQDYADRVPANEMIQKTNTALAFKAAGELTSRPAIIEVLAAMRSNPGEKLNDRTSLYLINLLQQQKQQDMELGRVANRIDNPREFLDAKDRYYENNPLVSPFTGKPLKTRADAKEDLDRMIGKNPETDYGIAGAPLQPPWNAIKGFANRALSAGQPPVQAAPQAPVKVATPEEARKLPSGTAIILPDGSPGRVP